MSLVSTGRTMHVSCQHQVAASVPKPSHARMEKQSQAPESPLLEESFANSLSHLWVSSELQPPVWHSPSPASIIRAVYYIVFCSLIAFHPTS